MAKCPSCGYQWDAGRGSRINPDWMPTEAMYQWAVKERADLNVMQQIDAFRDYWTAKTGTAATKRDWDATWRNWIRNARYTAKPAFRATITPSPTVDKRPPISTEQQQANKGRLSELLKGMFRVGS